MWSAKYEGEMGFLQKELGGSGGGGTCAFGSRDKEKIENNHFSLGTTFDASISFSFNFLYLLMAACARIFSWIINDFFFQYNHGDFVDDLGGKEKPIDFNEVSIWRKNLITIRTHC